MKWNQAIDRTGTGSYKWDSMAKRLGEQTQGVYPFSVADNDLPVAKELRKGLVQHLQTAVLGYTGMTASYKHAVVDWMKSRHDWTIDPSWIVTSPGVVTALYRCVKAFTQPGEGIVIQTPVYPPFFHAIEDSGRRVVSNPLIANNASYTMDFDDLESKLADPHTSMMILCSPHNPVGRVWKTDELNRVLQLCRQYDVVLVSDEIHFDLVRPGFSHTVAASLSESKGGSLITLTAPSKTFNIAGLQCANILIEDPVLRQRFIDEGSKDGSHGINALGLAACEIAYTRCEPWLNEFLSLIDANHRTVVEFMALHCPQIIVTPLEGTYLQWLNFRALGLSDPELEQFLVEKAQLVLTPGIDFGPEGSGFMRMNLGCMPQVLQEGLVRLAKAVNARLTCL